MNKAVIRKATSNDIKDIQSLNHELFLSDARFFNDLNVDWPYGDEGSDYFMKRINGKDVVCLLAEVDDKVVGYVVGGWSELNFGAYIGKRGELENISVTKLFQSQGVGKSLVEALHKWFKAQGASYVIVNVSTPNLKAIDFYKLQGFEPYSEALWHKL